MIVLVHGAWHGKWCWEPLERSLAALDVPSIALDLPGHGQDLTPLEDLTLDRYVAAVLDVITAIDEPVLLVGHSLGGVTISQVAERAPDRLRGLVYLAAVLVGDGQSIVDATAGLDGGIAGNVRFSDDGRFMSLDPAAAAAMLYAECDSMVAQAAIARLQPEPLVIASTPIQVTPERWGSVPRSYVVCTQDQAITPAAQRAMIEKVGVDESIELETSHSPFLSMPERLAAVLAALHSAEPHRDA